jgi:hypothetical protein
MHSSWSEITSCSVLVYFWFPFLVVVCIFGYGGGICALVMCPGCWWSLACQVQLILNAENGWIQHLKK